MSLLGRSVLENKKDVQGLYCCKFALSINNGQTKPNKYKHNLAIKNKFVFLFSFITPLFSLFFHYIFFIILFLIVFFGFYYSFCTILFLIVFFGFYYSFFIILFLIFFFDLLLFLFHCSFSYCLLF